jgi:hypothetical protein
MPANPTLQAIHSMLLKQVSALSQQLDDTTDAAAAQIITTEMQELVHRVSITQNLLFTAASSDLDSKLGPIQTANISLTASITSIGNGAKFIEVTTQFLGFVDTAIDLAKKIA